MGGRSSPGIFNSLLGAVEWIIKIVCEVLHLCHLLDDFLLADSRFENGRSLKINLSLFNLLEVPLTTAKNKIVGLSEP